MVVVVVVCLCVSAWQGQSIFGFIFFSFFPKLFLATANHTVKKNRLKFFFVNETRKIVWRTNHIHSIFFLAYQSLSLCFVGNFFSLWFLFLLLISSVDSFHWMMIQIETDSFLNLSSFFLFDVGCEERKGRKLGDDGHWNREKKTILTMKM